MPSSRPIRISVGSPGGIRSATWRVWFGPADIYAGFRTLGAIRKASIHFPRPGQPNTLRYVGYTRTYAEELHARSVMRHERTNLEWTGGQLQNEHLVEFRFRIPHTELRLLPQESEDKVVWIDGTDTSAMTEVTIVSGPEAQSTEHPVRGDGTPVRVLGKSALSIGRTVWVLSSKMPGPSEVELRDYRFQARHALAVQGLLPQAKATSEGARFNLTFECPDGSAGELELAADFLLRAEA